MFRIKACCLVLVLFGFPLVFGNAQLRMLRHKASPFLLVHNKDSGVSGLDFGCKLLDGMREMSGFAHFVV